MEEIVEHPAYDKTHRRAGDGWAEAAERGGFERCPKDTYLVEQMRDGHRPVRERTESPVPRRCLTGHSRRGRTVERKH